MSFWRMKNNPKRVVVASGIVDSLKNMLTIWCGMDRLSNIQTLIVTICYIEIYSVKNDMHCSRAMNDSRYSASKYGNSTNSTATMSQIQQYSPIRICHANTARCSLVTNIITICVWESLFQPKEDAKNTPKNGVEIKNNNRCWLIF